MTGLQSSTFSSIALVLAIMILIFFVTTAIAGKATEEHRFVQRRIDLVTDRKRQEELKKREKKRNKKKKNSEGESSFTANSGLFQKIGDAIFDELLSADIMMKAEEFAIIWIVITFVPALLAVMVSGNIYLPIVLCVIGAVLPVVYVKRKQAQRVVQFESQLSDALLICCNCLRSGLTFAQAMENIAQEMEAPIGTEFKRAVNEMSYGATLEDALNGMMERINSSDLNLTVAAVNVQRQTGGNLSQILEVISETIRDRLKIKAEVKTITAQGRSSGLIIGLLPVVVGAILMVVNPDYINTFFFTKAGNIMLVISGILEALGFFFINKIVTIKF